MAIFLNHLMLPFCSGLARLLQNFNHLVCEKAQIELSKIQKIFSQLFSSVRIVQDFLQIAHCVTQLHPGCNNFGRSTLALFELVAINLNRFL